MNSCRPRTRSFAWRVFSALAGPALSASAQVFVSPGSIVTAEGSGYLSTAPFNNVSRYQQIYDASQFLPLHAPRLITQIAFRPDASQTTAINHAFTNIEFHLSTATIPVTGLNANFASNVGANDTVVYSGSLTFTSANSIAWGTAKQFDLVVNLTTPFLYDPSAGNLLLEIRNYSSGFAGYIDGASDSSVRLFFMDKATT